MPRSVRGWATLSLRRSTPRSSWHRRIAACSRFRLRPRRPADRGHRWARWFRRRPVAGIVSSTLASVLDASGIYRRDRASESSRPRQRLGHILLVLCATKTLRPPVRAHQYLGDAAFCRPPFVRLRRRDAHWTGGHFRQPGRRIRPLLPDASGLDTSFGVMVARQ